MKYKKHTLSLALLAILYTHMQIHAMQQSQTTQLHKPQKLYLYAITPLKKLVLDGLAQQLLVSHPFNHIQAIKDALYSIVEQNEQLVVTQETCVI